VGSLFIILLAGSLFIDEVGTLYIGISIVYSYIISFKFGIEF